MRFVKSEPYIVITVSIIFSLLFKIILNDILSKEIMLALMVLFFAMSFFAEKKVIKESNKKIENGTFKIKRSIDDPEKLRKSKNLRFLRYWNIYLFSIYYLSKK